MPFAPVKFSCEHLEGGIGRSGYINMLVKSDVLMRQYWESLKSVPRSFDRVSGID